MKYTPKTTDELRKLTAIYAQTAAQEARINSIWCDLAHCEQCLAEREAEVERLKVIAIQFAKAIPKPTGIIVCPTCEGTGEYESGSMCKVCMGRGHLNMESIQ